ncbi:YfiR family protein, partial [Burkholderia sp. SIMBA_043]
ASHAAVSTPVRAAAIAAHTASGRPGRVATLRRAFVAIVCVLSGAPAVLAGASADPDEPGETVRIAAPGPAVTPANPAISSHDSTVRQVVL